MIPAKIIIETPLPIPFSVICSPNQVTNIVPVEQIKGVNKTESGKEEYTIYSNCYDLDNKTLYYTTYENRQIVAVTLNEDKNGNRLIAYPFERKQVINKLN